MLIHFGGKMKVSYKVTPPYLLHYNDVVTLVMQEQQVL